jgi:hypothetical protein
MLLSMFAHFLCETSLQLHFLPASPLSSQPNQELHMGKGNNSQKKEVKKPKKEKPKVLATRKTN